MLCAAAMPPSFASTWIALATCVLVAATRFVPDRRIERALGVK